MYCISINLLPDSHLMMLFNELPIYVLYQCLLPDLHLMMVFNKLPICVDAFQSDLHLIMLFNEPAIYVLDQYLLPDLHLMMLQSLEPLNTCLLSGEITVHVTLSWCPRRMIKSSKDGSSY